MMKVGIFALFVGAVPQAAAAQTMQWTDKGFVSVNVGVQVGSQDLNTSTSFSLYEETATVSSSQKVTSGAFFDIGGAYRVWGKNLLAGVTYLHTTSDADASIAASIPDPAQFDRPRAVTSTASGAKHTENVVHLNVIWMMPVAEKLDVGVFAGPSIFSIKQGVVGTPTVTEPGPIVNAPIVEVKKTTAGFNAGVDVQYMIAKKWGVGGVARYTWGSASIDGATDKLTVGGFQIGAGARLRF
jgi:hypothetical protein